MKSPKTSAASPIRKVKLDDLKPHPRQRLLFPIPSEEQLAALARDMKANGQIHPIEVLPDMTIIAGHCRVEAARINGWTEIDAVVREDLAALGDLAIEGYLIRGPVTDFVQQRLEYDETAFEAAGRLGHRSCRTKKRLYRRDENGRWLVPAGIVPALVADLQRAGRHVEVHDCRRLPHRCKTINEALWQELTDPERCLLTAVASNALGRITDSLYVCRGIERLSRWRGNRWQRAGGGGLANARLWQRVERLLARHQVTCQWVRGHSGCEGNELADGLARGAATAHR